ncbi:carbonic anhydrase [Nocardia goodfellowii]
MRTEHVAHTSPIAAWKSLCAGNRRFVTGRPRRRTQAALAGLVDGQRPSAVVFGCGDSRVATEIIFDQGLGDMFVVRTAGHVIDSVVLGSIEYGVAVLRAPLIVVLGHERCGAVAAAIDALDNGVAPGGFVQCVVDRVTPSIVRGRRAGLTEVEEFEVRHVEETARLLMRRSSTIADRVAVGDLAIACATYRLVDGHAQLRSAIGALDQPGVEPPPTSRE